MKEEFCIMLDNPPYWRNHREDGLHRHEVFFGTANRKLSDKFGLKVDLCHECHNEPPNGVHFSNIQCRFLQKIAQSEAMRYYGWSKDEFMQIFGRNYL